ncbi:TPA: nitrate reductase molybdenum cofactor assembly chaperone [Corynebacterium striatum]|uniref:Nitrate reductase delta subunit n=1 Tax=Corynebacterium striatum TaxID=43770 RepID=A0AAQ1TVE9_CORST|nr:MULTISPECIES: nitrate reductase molybdenum cofactor assembly chaperone [Corynebacterium]ATZ07646.1 nitrate reductase molybdenum cofactor assembly chaperone [Corynebacterium striatum]EEI79719.1 nitrate reductase molybdenum cofactor assembly chaperone [Corynebacterium striatum ATCC 6940]EGT5593060.1 nitrate reductase molybdenum cofactor assembly chaperone [Corynebacterium striatum]EGT5612236.1 nitrate reductase molybdenum cofactor assembly chaperone [Corynebacterium striatum]KAA1271178.1 nitr
MNIFEKLAARAAQPPQDDAVAGFGTVSGVPAGIGSLGGAADVKRTARTHTGQVPTDFVTPVAVDETQRRIVAMAASVLLRYPEEDFLSHLDVVQDQLDQLPMALATDFMGFIDAARTAGLRALQEHYVETFDQRRRCSLFLSYYAVGDTRQRGMAILSFSQQLESFGFQLAENELPDHLCVVLEALGLAEGKDHARAVEMLASYREGIEVLRAALSQQDSPYVRLIVAVCKALPEVDAETAQKYVDLIRTGPPAEMVGIADLPFPTAQPDLV